MTLQIQFKGGISMYVNVHVIVHDTEKLMDVFRSALVKEFHKDTGILFENNILKMKLFFEETPPQETIYAFCDCGNISYLKYNYSDTEDHDTSQPETSNGEELKSKPTSGEAEKSDTGKAKNSPLETPATKKSKKYAAKEKAVSIPEFEEISRTANSKSDFLNGIMSILEVPSELQNAFLQIVAIYPELDKVTWDSILAALSEKGVAFNSYNRRVLCDLTTKKLNLRFINVIASINRILSEHEDKNTDDTSKKKQEDEIEGENVSQQSASDEKKHDEEFEGESSEQSETSEKKQDEESEGRSPDQPEVEKENQGEEREILFKCMPKFVESEHAQHVNSIEQMLKELKSEDSFDVRLEKATIILASKCMPVIPKEKSLADLLLFTSNAMRTVGNENHTYLRPETVTDDKLEQNLIRMQILTWTTIANNLAKFYDPNFTGKITSADFLSDLKELLQ